MRRLLCLPISGPTGASARYRAYQYLPGIEAAGWRVQVHPPAESRSQITRPLVRSRDYLAVLQAARGADLVWIQKRLLPMTQVAALKAMGRPIVFDFDDAVFCRPGAQTTADGKARQTRRLQAILRAADMVIAGNEYLAEYAARYARHVEVLPTVIDLARYTPRTPPTTPGRTIGWIGAASTLPYLEAMEPALREVHRQLPDARLHVVCDRPPEISGIPVDFSPWQEASEVGDIQRFDVGIMPLPDDAWTRGKCACKALQYMAAVVPTVASPVGVNRSVIVDGVSGRLCTTPEEWGQTLTQLLHDAAQRTALGTAGRERVRDRYALEVATPRLLGFFDSLTTTTQHQALPHDHAPSLVPPE